MSKVLVVAVHADDETLGCAGTLLKHKSNGDEIFWFIVTSINQDNSVSQSKILERKMEIKKVKEEYGFAETIELCLPARKVDKIPMHELIAKISEVFNRIKPSIVYLPFRNDAHSDHRVVFEAAYSCTKSFRQPFIKKILMMETISETEFSPSMKDCVFIPNYFIDISLFINEKLRIMSIFKNELGEHPFPRNLDNIKALAVFRGASSGCKYAESFMLLREIW